MLQITNATVTSAADAFHVEGAIADIAVSGSSVTSSNGVLLNTLSSGATTLTASASQLTGAITTDSASTANVTLQSGAVWNLTGNSNLTNLTFNNGELKLLGNFNVAATGPITLNGPGLANGGTIDSNGYLTTVAQVITGAGGLTVTDSSDSGAGKTILTGANTYTGGTTISSGTLQLGNGGTSGSIMGGVADNGTLAFDRSDTATFAGVISGSGVVAQIGSGTTILTSDNSYSGGTTISAGTLQVGNSGGTGSLGSGPVLGTTAHWCSIAAAPSLFLAPLRGPEA